MLEWRIVVTILGGRTNNIIDITQMIFNIIDEGEALDKAIEKSLSEFDYIGTKVVMVRIIKAGV